MSSGSRNAEADDSMERTADLPAAEREQEANAAASRASSETDDRDDPPPQTLVWPPPEDALAGWEILQLESTGRTLVEPSRHPSDTKATRTGPAAPHAVPSTTPSSIATPPAVPGRPLAPPVLSDPDRHLPETELIEPLHGKPVASGPPVRRPPVPSPPGSARSTPTSGPVVIRPVSDRAVADSRDDTRPRIVRPVPSTATPVGGAAADDTVDPAAQTRIIQIPPGFGRGRAAEVPHDLALRDTADSDATRIIPRPPIARPIAERQERPPQVQEPPVTATPEGASPRRVPFWLIALVIIVILAIAEITYLVVRTLQPAAAPTSTGTLVVESAPVGAEVYIDGALKGRTPLRVDILAGAHELEVRSGELRRTRSVSLEAGALASYNVELGPVPVPTASIEVRSEPSGARVSIGGIDRGRTPVTIAGLEPGRHQVRVSGPFRAMTRQVTLSAGQRALVVVTPAAVAPDTDPAPDAGDVAPARQAEEPAATTGGRAPSARTPTPGSQAAAGGGQGAAASATPAASGRGWLTVESPLVLRIVRNGDFLGTSEDSRIPLPAGTHVISLENEGVNFRDVRTIEVAANRPLTLPIALPQGTLNINAQPWAEVFVDNQRIGETPVSQLALPVGTHEVLFRHPQFGERRATVVVKVGVPARTFTDFTK